jgi:N-acetylglucosamine-6-phosphate deacetylase
MAGRLILQNGSVVSGEEILTGYSVAVRNGTIEEVFPYRPYTPEEGDNILDCSGQFICPGFIDLHNQGGGGYSVTDGTEEGVYGMARAHAAHGTTGLLLTPPIIEGEWRYLLPVLAVTVGKRSGGAAILGIHAEGPFLNPRKAGCMPRAGILEPDPKLLGDILELGGDTIREMTIAPELPGALDLILTLARNGVVPSLGHSDATLDDVLRAIDHGASHVTHFFNAMSPLHHREPGLAGAALYSTDLSVELVADGNHVHPWIMGLTVQNKTVMLSCLVTDAMSPTGLPDGEYRSLGLAVRSDRGRLSLADHPETLAGSVLTLDRAVANMITMVGLNLSDAVAMASTTPAAVLGLEDRKGRLEPGYDADITVLDRRFSATATVVDGEIVFRKE